MAGSEMLGVILWSDKSDGTAVIWCEDHGELALFRPQGASTGNIHFAEGDLIEFEISDTSHVRFAVNPRQIYTGTQYDVTGKMYQALSDTRADMQPRRRFEIA